MVPTPSQCRAARGLINISRPELSRRSGVSLRAIAGFENGETVLMRLNHEAIRQAFEQAGVVFIGRTGVQLREDYL
jgi:transcriptional regulator with XRE-family HTH domain